MKWLIPAFVCAGVLLVGCGGRTLKGTWSVLPVGRDEEEPTMITFTPPDKIVCSYDLPKGEGTIRLVGIYKLAGDQLTTRYDHVEVDAKGRDAEAMKETIINDEKRRLEIANKVASSRIVWDGYDGFYLDDSSGKPAFRFKRVY